MAALVEPELVREEVMGMGMEAVMEMAPELVLERNHSEGHHNSYQMKDLEDDSR